VYILAQQCAWDAPASPAVGKILHKIAIFSDCNQNILYQLNHSKDADILYTDTWVNIEFMNDPKFKEEKERRFKTFMPYQINATLLKETGSNAKIMHCLPAHIGYEITRDAIDHPNSIIFDQAENRLHAQKSLILFLLGLFD